MSEPKQGFWASIPGILTGIAAVITAITGLVFAFGDINKENSSTNKQANNSEQQASTSQDRPTTGEQTTSPPTKADEPDVIEGVIDVVTILPKEKINTQQDKEILLEPLINCENSVFKSVNTTTSLMSWSNYYYKQINDASGQKRSAYEPCKMTIKYRGLAYCQQPANLEVRQALYETIALCKQADITVDEIVEDLAYKPGAK